MKIGIDIGYGFTKAINEKAQQVVFPSLVAPAGSNYLKDVFADNDKYRVAITTGRQRDNFLIGEAARHSFAVSQVLNKDKPADLHDPLLLTAVSLLGDSANDFDLAVGLPLAYYASQKESLRDRLQCLSAYVRVFDEERYISCPRVRVLPQGAGVLLRAGSQLPSRGYLGVVDIGTYTTEFLLFEMRHGQPVPVHESCGSVEVGTHLVYSAVGRDFQARTGSPLPVSMEQEIVERALKRETVQYYGKSYSFGDAAYTARRNITTVISQRVLAAWGNHTGYVQATFLAGGGAMFFGSDLIDSFPCPQMVDDPVFANAAGYLAFI